MSEPGAPLNSTRLQDMALAVRLVASACPDGPGKAGAYGAAHYLETVAKQREKGPVAAEPVLRLQANATERELREARSRQAVRRGDEVFLPLGKPGSVALPNLLLRSALFSSSNAQGEAVKEETIATQGDVSITLTGLRLGGYDRRVFSACLGMYQKGRPLQPSAAKAQEAWVQTSFYQLSLLIETSYGERVKDAIRASLIRLNAALLRVRVRRRDIPLPRLIEVAFDDGQLDGHGASVAFRMHECIAQLFGQNAWTHVTGEALHGFAGLSGWLASFYHTHAKPYPILVADLHRYSGQDCEPREFRRRLVRALTRLQAEDVAEQIRVEGFDLDGGLLTVRLTRWRAS